MISLPCCIHGRDYGNSTVWGRNLHVDPSTMWQDKSESTRCRHVYPGYWELMTYYTIQIVSWYHNKNTASWWWATYRPSLITVWLIGLGLKLLRKPGQNRKFSLNVNKKPWMFWFYIEILKKILVLCSYKFRMPFSYLPFGAKSVCTNTWRMFLLTWR